MDAIQKNIDSGTYKRQRNARPPNSNGKNSHTAFRNNSGNYGSTANGNRNISGQLGNATNTGYSRGTSAPGRQGRSRDDEMSSLRNQIRNMSDTIARLGTQEN
jgi:hypothetical protein